MSASITINLIIAVAVLTWTSYTNNWNFIHGIGSLVGGYFIAWLIYLLVKILTKTVNKNNAGQNGGQYYNIASFILLGSTIGNIHLNSIETKDNKTTFEISHAIGEIAGICEASKHLSTHHCEHFTIGDEATHTCENSALSLAPISFRNEIESALVSEGFKYDIEQLNSKIDNEFATAKLQPNFSQSASCKTLSEHFSKKYGQSIEKLNKLKGKN